MRTLKLIDIELMLPDEVGLTEREPEPGVLLYGLSGTAVSQLRALIDAIATDHGYELRRSPIASHLLRRTQRINVIASEPGRLDITVDDPESLPSACVDENRLILGSVSIAIDAARVTPGRQRHNDGSTLWKAEWQIYGEEAEQLSEKVRVQFVQQGLRADFVWPPAEGGIQQWLIEARSPQRLVKAYVRPTGDHNVLSVTLIDETLKIPA